MRSYVILSVFPTGVFTKVYTTYLLSSGLYGFSRIELKETIFIICCTIFSLFFLLGLKEFQQHIILQYFSHFSHRVFEEELIQRLESEEQALCIVNTKKSAQRIYQSIKDKGVYHLSTSMYPAHRKRVLDEIRERLKKQEKCVVVSTSLVEAGVDLDFQTVYRQLAGADSFISSLKIYVKH